MTKAIIAGGRNFVGARHHTKYLDKIHAKIKITEVVSGCARGADIFGEEWAKRNNIPVWKFPADWNKYGKSAGVIRNKEMAQVADACILFPGGRGTADMNKQATKLGIRVIIWPSELL